MYFCELGPLNIPLFVPVKRYVEPDFFDRYQTSGEVSDTFNLN